ncbi:MAG: 30S ribosomal protein S17 [Gaiellaceae bacterium]
MAKKNEEETQGQVEETPAEEPEAEATPAAEDAPVEEPASEEAPVAEEAPAEEEPQEEPAEEPAPEPVAEEEPVAEAEAEPEAAGVEAESAPAVPAPGPKPKRKHVPRSERRQRSKPKREKPAERKPITRLPKPEHARGVRKERRGVVVSAAMDKTIVVRVDTVKPHPVYKKIVRRSTRLHAHDEANVAKPGDLVRLVETRPVSKTKVWRLAEVLEEAK